MAIGARIFNYLSKHFQVTESPAHQANIALQDPLPLDELRENTPGHGLVIDGSKIKDKRLYPDEDNANFYLGKDDDGNPILFFTSADRLAYYPYADPPGLYLVHAGGGLLLVASGEIRLTSPVTIGAFDTPDASAVADLQSVSKGFLPPRMTTEQREAISSPAAGLVVYDTDENRLYLNAE